MASVLLWTGILFIVAGWLTLAWHAGKAITHREEFEKFPEKKRSHFLKRSYSRITIIIGIALIIISISI